VSEKIPVERALILWNDEQDANPDHKGVARVVELHVVDIQAQPSWARDLNASAGACGADWLKGHWRETPMGVFLELVTADGFVSDEIKVDALQAFAQIEGQEVWTRDLLHEFDVDVD
jgi:hypothetical protein